MGYARDIVCSSNNKQIKVTLEFSQNKTAEHILKELPIESIVNTWGDEIYFVTSISAPVDNLTTDLNVGDVAYWPEGKCICIFFGRTPASIDERPKPASGVAIVGSVSADIHTLKKIQSGDPIRIS